MTIEFDHNSLHHWKRMTFIRCPVKTTCPMVSVRKYNWIQILLDTCPSDKATRESYSRGKKNKLEKAGKLMERRRCDPYTVSDSELATRHFDFQLIDALIVISKVFNTLQSQQLKKITYYFCIYKTPEFFFISLITFENISCVYPRNIC